MAEFTVRYKINPVAEYVNIFIHCKETKKHLSAAINADDWFQLTGEDIRK